nr:unnamed protein product [Spirometra erinaceieuropaei]
MQHAHLLTFVISNVAMDAAADDGSYSVSSSSSSSSSSNRGQGSGQSYLSHRASRFASVCNTPATPNQRAVCRVAGAHIDRISPADLRDEDSEIILAIGFGPDLLKEVYPEASKRGVESFNYKARTFKGGSMPATGGDIWIHASCAEYGKLFELSQAIQSEVPQKAIEKTEEVYGFRYQNGRDLSGFIDGTENPADADERQEVAISKATGGSYVVTQRWLHDFSTITKQPVKTMEDWIGRTKEDSIEIKPVAVHSHVGRMTAGLSDAEADSKRIVRHSMPYGSVTGEAGLFFIGYSSTPKTLDWMLDRMAGLTPDGTADSLFNFTKPLTGTYFYVPSQVELQEIFKKCSK